MNSKTFLFSLLLVGCSLEAADAPRSPQRSPKNKLACKSSLKKSPRTDRYMGAVSAMLEHELGLRPKFLDFTCCAKKRTVMQKCIGSALKKNVEASLRELEEKSERADFMPLKNDDVRSPESLSRGVSVTPESKGGYSVGAQRFLFGNKD